MPDRVSIREDLQIIRVDSWGAVTEGDMRATLQAVIGIEQESGLNRVLVDATRVESLPSEIVLYGFGSEMALAMGRIRAAAVVSGQVRTKAEFLAGVAAGRGAQFNVFRSEESALTWLLQRTDSRSRANAG